MVTMAHNALMNMHADGVTHFDDAIDPTDDELVELKLTSSHEVCKSVSQCVSVTKFYLPILRRQLRDRI